MKRWLFLFAALSLGALAHADVHRAGGPHLADDSPRTPAVPGGAACWFSSGPAMTLSSTVDEWRDAISGRRLTADGTFGLVAPAVAYVNGCPVAQFDHTTYTALTSLQDDWCPLGFPLTECNPFEFVLVGSITGGGGNGPNAGIASIFNRAGGAAIDAQAEQVFDHSDWDSGSVDVSEQQPSWQFVSPAFGQPTEVTDIHLDPGEGTVWVEAVQDGGFYFSCDTLQGNPATVWWTARKDVYVNGTFRTLVSGGEGTAVANLISVMATNAPTCNGPSVFGMTYQWSHSRRDLQDNSPITTLWDESSEAALSAPIWQEGTLWKNAEEPLVYNPGNPNPNNWRYDWGGRAIYLGMHGDSLSQGYCSYMDGWVGEFAVYNRKLTADERLQWTLYAMRKYGIIP